MISDQVANSTRDLSYDVWSNGQFCKGLVLWNMIKWLILLGSGQMSDSVNVLELSFGQQNLDLYLCYFLGKNLLNSLQHDTKFWNIKQIFFSSQNAWKIKLKKTLSAAVEFLLFFFIPIFFTLTPDTLVAVIISFHIDCYLCFTSFFF